MSNISEKVFLGTSGWSYKEWIGPFYSKEDKSMLRAFTRVFKTVEIDSTFYRYPSKGTVMGWTRYSPEGFVYTAKLPGLITHDKKLELSQGIEDDLNRFVELMEPLWLGGKLGCILIQLPPKFDYRPVQLKDFFKILPSQIKFAVEFRDRSWIRQETWNLLQEYKVAYTIVDEPLLPPEVHVTSDIAYFRWHGQGSRPWYNYRYSSEELKPWVPKVKDTTAKVIKTYGYFNNHYHGYAVENCLQILEMLGALTSEQERAKQRVEKNRSAAQFKEFKLETFMKPDKLSFEELLEYFVPSERLKRAEGIQDGELKVRRQVEKRTEAMVKDYHIVIDLEQREILHDCADWTKTLPAKKLCKHIAKLLLSIDRQKAAVILKKLYKEKDSWRFGTYT